MSEDNPQRARGSRGDDDAFMRAALDEARAAGMHGEVPIGALIVREGQVLATARNRTISDADPTAHAEILAIRRAAAGIGNYRLNGCTLYVTLEPCAMCAGAMVQARIKRLVYGCSDPKAGAAGSLYDIPGDDRLNHRIEVSSGVRASESASLLQEFFRTRRV